jgi:hypothetical protein
MKAFLSSIVAALVIAVGAMYALESSVQRQSDEAFMTTTGARLPSHGETHNLVGKDWYTAKEH